jgi:hypothetical protein
MALLRVKDFPDDIYEKTLSARGKIAMPRGAPEAAKKIDNADAGISIDSTNTFWKYDRSKILPGDEWTCSRTYLNVGKSPRVLEQVFQRKLFRN